MVGISEIFSSRDLGRSVAPQLCAPLLDFPNQFVFQCPREKIRRVEMRG